MKNIKKFLVVSLALFIVLGNLGLINFASATSNPDRQNRNDKISLDSVSKPEYVSGEIIVKYKDSQINLDTSSGKVAAMDFSNRKSLKNKEHLIKNNASVLTIEDGKTVEQKIAELQTDPNVEYAEPNYKRYLSAISSNDTYKDLLWGLDNTGQSVNGTSGTTDKDIDAPEAWTTSEGTSTVVVAVIDSGVAYNHPDLQANMWDGTGCVDENGGVLGSCNYGYDYEDNDKTPLPVDSSHGTHIAGIIAAAKNNSKGVIGVAPNVKIMAIKFGLDIAGEVKAIDFAIQNGVKIINASFGGSSYSATEYNAINRFKAAGGILVASAGNEAVNNEVTHSYPSDYDLDNIISVAATDQDDALASFSNYGATSVDVGAPGETILSTVANESLLYEDFEGVTPPAVPSGWTKAGVSTSSNWGTYGTLNKSLWGDLAYPAYANNMNTTITLPGTYDLSAGGWNIDFYTQCDTPAGHGDYMSLELSTTSGSTWSEFTRWDQSVLDGYSGSFTDGYTTGYSFSTTTPPQFSTANVQMRFRWVTDGSGNIYDGCALDDLIISKIGDGSGEYYDYKNGTSMAAPFVAGLVALIESYRPSLTYSQVRDVVLTTGDDIASLHGKTSSGRRINAFNALNSLVSTSSSAKAITSFTVPGQIGTTIINESAHTISLTVPYGTNVTALIATFTTTGSSTAVGATPQVSSTTPNDFTSPVTYVVTAADASTQAYVVTVTVAANSAKAITTFNFTSPAATGVINEGAHTIGITVPYGTNVTALVPTITITGASVSPASGVAHNFTSTSTYTVTAADASQQAYSVAVTVAPNSSKTITSFTIPGQVGTTTINEASSTISLTVPYGSNTDLIATFITTGSSVAVGATIQISSTTPNNFTNPVTYVVTAADSSTRSYTVTVTVAAPSSEVLIDFSNYTVSNASSTITNVPFGTSKNTFMSGLISLVRGQGWDTSGISDPVVTGNTLVVTAQDGTTTKTYTITVNAPSSVATVTSGTYTVNDASSTITNITYGTASSTFLAAITKGEANQSWNISSISNPVVTGNTLVVTAQDGVTTKTYTVTVNLNTAKAITSFSVPGQVGTTTIDETNHTIKIIVPNGTVVTALVPTITTTGTSTNPVTGVAHDFTSTSTYTVTAEDSSTQDYVVSVIILTAIQTAPDNSGTTNISTTTPQVLIINPDQALTITSDNGISNPSFDISALLTNGIGTIPAITLSSSVANIAIPASTTITSASTTWNGVMTAPTVTTVTLPATSGYTKTLSTAIEIGFTGAKLSFDKGVRILIPGQANKRAGYVRNGITFTEITSTCSSDSQLVGNALSYSDGDCKINSGSDLVIWTKHFTTFATYTQTQNSTSRSGGGGGGASSIVNQVNNLIASGNLAAAQVLMNQWPGLFPNNNNPLFSSLATTTFMFTSQNIFGNQNNVVSGQSFVFTRDLTVNSIGEDVRQLQIFLNSNGYILTQTGPGSPGNETTKFGDFTRDALAKFQNANYDALLKPNNITKGGGYFGLPTRNFLNNLLTKSVQTNSAVSSPVISIGQFIELLLQLGAITQEKADSTKLSLGL